MFENRVLRRIHRPKRNEITGEWRNLHNEELNDLYPSHKYYPGDKIKNNKTGRACSTYGEKTGAYRGWWGNQRETDHWEDLDVVRRIIVRCIFRKWDVKAWTGLIWLKIGIVGGPL